MSAQLKSSVAGVLAALAAIIGGTEGNLSHASPSQLVLSVVAGAVSYLAGVLIVPEVKTLEQTNPALVTDARKIAGEVTTVLGPPYNVPAAFPASADSAPAPASPALVETARSLP